MPYAKPGVLKLFLSLLWIRVQPSRYRRWRSASDHAPAPTAIRKEHIKDWNRVTHYYRCSLCDTYHLEGERLFEMHLFSQDSAGWQTMSEKEAARYRSLVPERNPS